MILKSFKANLKQFNESEVSVVCHVAVDASIQCATANNTKNPCKIRLYEGFYNLTKCVIFMKKSTLDIF